MRPLAGLVIAYLAGSIPFAYLAGRLFKGIDLREHGSGNLGVTNVYRVKSWKVASGGAAIVGHGRSVFLLWRGGGKGVATAGGVILALAPVASLISIAMFAVIVYLTGYV